MKRNILLSTVFVVSLLVSCSTKKQVVNSQESQTTSKEDTYEAYAENVGVSETETTNDPTVNRSSGAMNDVEAKTTTYDNSGYDYDQMFGALKMTDEQIRQFRMGMEKFQSRRVSTPNGEMLGTIESERDRQLENILTEEQLTIYRSLE